MAADKPKSKQLVILSGKGGTGKTSISAALAHLCALEISAKNTILVDADVDAANLSLAVNPFLGEPNKFWGGSLAHIDTLECIGCGSCESVCRYDAVMMDQEHPGAYKIDTVACDGCAACVYACPVDAIQMLPQQEGIWFESRTNWGKLIHAELFPGRENSGKLVTLLRQKAAQEQSNIQTGLIIIDGPPGIGCPVISASTGVDLALIVTEPSLSGLHDLKRILGVLNHFNIPSLICINKADIYEQGAKDIRMYAAQNGLQMTADVPFDESIPDAMISGLPVTVAQPDSKASRSVRLVWSDVLKQLSPDKDS
jgi:MinD superfamily P-loop ATPase